MAALYCVLIDKMHDRDIPPMAKALSKHRGIPLQDAAFSARRSWGILEEGAEKTAASHLVECLKTEGVGAVAIPAGLMEDMPPALEVPRLELLRGKFRAWLKSGTEEWVNGSDLALIASAGFHRARRARQPPAPMPRITLEVYPREEDTPVRKETELVFYLDLFISEPPRRLRLDSQDFDYSCLRSRMSYNTLSNFKRLVMILAGKSRSAPTNRGTQIILDGGPVNAMGYESLTDLDRESRWLLTLQALDRL